MPNINFEDMPEIEKQIPDKFEYHFESKLIKAKRVSPNSFEFTAYNKEGQVLHSDIKDNQYVHRNILNGTWDYQVIKDDAINKPPHYHKNEIDVNGYLEKHFPLEGSYTVAEGFYIGNVIKYTSRYKDKGGKQDLEKAKFNLNKLIELEESK